MPGSVSLEGFARCPVCGAPMSPGTSQEVVACGWCGTYSHLARRVRTIEPPLAGGFEPALVAGRPDGPEGDARRAVPCPACGGPLGSDLAQEIVRCPHCSAHAKVELELHADDMGQPAAYVSPRHRFGFLRRRRIARDQRRDAAFEATLAETDPDAKARSVAALTPWEALTQSREALLTSLLEQAPAHSLVDRAVCGLVDRFLQVGEQDGPGFEGHPWRFFVLRCATRVAFRPEASGRLVRELEHVRGGGAALKLLLDVADYALATEQLDYGEDALDAISATLADPFNYADRHAMYEVMAYRLPYVDERLAAWLLTQTSVTWVAFLEPRALARLVDDCGLERPEVAPVIANQASYLPCPGLGEYRSYLDFLQTLFTPLGRALALESYVFVPGAGARHFEPATVERCLSIFQALRAVPDSEIAATRLLRWWIDDLAAHAPDALPDTVAALRQEVPEDPPWPPPPRPTTYDEELERTALGFREAVEARSHAEDDGPGPQDEEAYARRKAVEQELDEADRERGARRADEKWGAYRRGG